MLGSSSTTRSRASGALPRAGRPGRELPDTSPPEGADAVVMREASVRRLQSPWTLPVSPLGGRPRRPVRRSAAHGPTAAPVADGVVLGSPEAPPPAQVGSHGAHRGGLGTYPGEDVPARPVEGGDRV